MASGKIIKWIEDKGFGFIRIEGEQGDIFVHISAFGRIPRSPKVGEPVEIDALSEENGKKKATRARIPGLVPQPNFISKRRSGPSRHQSQRPSKRSYGITAAAALLIVAGLFWGYHKLTDRSSPMPAGTSTQEQPAPQAQPQQFHCEGKTHCSEMGSKAEAEFYLHNCPNTEMDGDGDGDPCERQFSSF